MFSSEFDYYRSPRQRAGPHLSRLEARTVRQTPIRLEQGGPQEEEAGGQGQGQEQGQGVFWFDLVIHDGMVAITYNNEPITHTRTTIESPQGLQIQVHG